MYFDSQKKLKAVTFSCDDGTTQDIRLIELLNKYGLKCTFNLNSELLSQNTILIRNNMRIAHYKIHAEDVKYIYEGHEIAVHTLTHPNLTTLEKNEVIRQVEADRLKLSELAGYEIVGMAYPCGGINNDDRVAEIIKNHTGVKYSRKELTPEIVNRLIRRIEVHNSEKIDGRKRVKLDVYFTAVGLIDIPDENELREMMEEIRRSA